LISTKKEHSSIIIIKELIKNKLNISIDLSKINKEDLGIKDYYDIANQYDLIIEELDIKRYYKIEEFLLPAIAKINNKFVILLKYNKNTNEFLIKDIDDKKSKIIKKNPKKIYVFLKKDELNILKSNNQWFKNIIKSEKKTYFQILYISLFINLFMIVTPMYMMSIYDRIIPGAGYASLYTLTLGVLLIFIFDFIFKIVRSNMMNKINFNINNKVEQVLTKKILKIKTEYDKTTIGHKYNLFKEISIIKEFFSNQTMIVFLELPFFIIGIFLFITLSENLIYIILIMSSIMFFINYIVQLKLKSLYDSLHIKEMNKNDFIIEISENKQNIINNGLINDKIIESQNILNEQEYFMNTILLYKSNFSTFLQVLMQLTTILILFFGVFEVINQTMTIGYLIALSILSSRIMMPIVNINMNYFKYYDVKKSFKIINQFLKLPEYDINDKEKINIKEIRGNFILNDISFKYNNNIIFEKLFLKINENDKIGIIGEVGSGKSTLKKILLKQLTILSGNINVDNYDLNKINHQSFLKNIGIMEENIKLYKGSLFNNLNLNNIYKDEDSLYKKLRKLKLEKLFGNDKEFLSIYIDEKGNNLSKGQKQIISFLRMILSNPKVLILDEPISGLDMVKQEFIKNYLKEFTKDKTLIIMTHDFSLLNIVDDIFILGNKKIMKKLKKEDFFKSIKG